MASLKGTSSNRTLEVRGAGPPLLLVHGLGGTSNLWGAQIPVLDRFFTTIRMDLPGSGRADAPAHQSTEFLADHLIALADSLGHQTFHILAHSYGAVVSQNLAMRYPARVLSLAFLGPIREAGAPAKQALANRAATARAEGLVSIADATAMVGTSASTKASRPEIAAFVREQVMAQDPQGYAAMCEAVAATQAADLSTIDCRALIVTGDEDATAPPAVAKAVADGIRNSSFSIIEGCGHWTPIEKPQEVNRILLNFYLT